MSATSMEVKASVGLANSLSNVFKLVGHLARQTNPRFRPDVVII